MIDCNLENQNAIIHFQIFQQTDQNQSHTSIGLTYRNVHILADTHLWKHSVKQTGQVAEEKSSYTNLDVKKVFNTKGTEMS